ncbi:hypothetical protein NQ318_001334 [Aromia moschata]|uniref:Uncharacterized protein n=1 Tax=Aromia moschata TaxID=1265417 RepID=A0AAV8ZGR9_9CUCU|nr:hypothetical protein NQ318_001334 [Aromia moschata]
MSYLTESLKIEILMMIGYGDRARTQCEVVRLFRETHPDLPPLNQGTISKIEAQYREMGTKLNLLLALEENPITPARQLARDRPFFFDDTLNGARYLRLLQHELMPVLCHLFPNPLNPNLTDERLWFQQDGAPPHYAAIVRQYLDRIFPGRWIGRRETQHIADLQERIREEIGKITPQMLHNVRDETYHRLGCCQQTLLGNPKDKINNNEKSGISSGNSAKRQNT